MREDCGHGEAKTYERAADGHAPRRQSNYRPRPRSENVGVRQQDELTRRSPGARRLGRGRLQQKLLPLQIRHMDCGCAVSMARMLAIRRAFGEVARRSGLNVYGKHGHGSERYSENELLHV